MVADKVTTKGISYTKEALQNLVLENKGQYPIFEGYTGPTEEKNQIGKTTKILFQDNKLMFEGIINDNSIKMKVGDSIGPTFHVEIPEDNVINDVKLVAVNYCGDIQMALDDLKITKMSGINVCYYHNDMDGIASAAIALQNVPDCKCIKIDHKKDMIDEVLRNEEWKGNSVMIVDFAFAPEIMQRMIQESESFTWIDHHKSAMERNPKIWVPNTLIEVDGKTKIVEGIRALDKAGCELTWEYCMGKGNPMPQSIKMIGDYDMWKFKHLFTKEFGAGLALKTHSPYDKIWKDLLLPQSHFLPILIKMGEPLVEAQTLNMKRNFKRGWDTKMYQQTGDTNKTYTCRMMNTNNETCSVGNYACTKGYDIGMVWYVQGKNQTVYIGVYSIKDDVDVSKIAKSYGGGGHFHAAGFEMEFDKFKEEFIDGQ